MKSRKKVSCKKPAHRTRMRRSQVCRRRRTKRGGMMRSARTLIYQDILPLIRAQQIIYNTGHDPQPDQGSITKANERFYQTFADIPVDDGIKESIRNLREELNNKVKIADKMKSIKDKYDAIMAKLEEERKKKDQARARARWLKVVGNPYTPTSQYIASVTDVSSPRMNQQILQQFVNQPFSSPNIERYPEYLTQTGTPAKPPAKSELSLLRNRAEIDHDDDDDDNDNDNDNDNDDNDEPKTPSKILFGTETPMSSPHIRSPPPPPGQRRNQENRNPQLQLGPLSPSTSILKKIDFSNTE